ncbi:MAG: hypothetical protein ACYDAG_17650, partial [Chloroflexota bacterium]
MTTPIVDVDGHLLEPADLWEKRLPAKFKGRAPRMMKDAHNHDRIVVDGKWFPKPDGKGAGKTDGLGGGYTQDGSDPSRYESRLRGGFDPIERLKYMDAEGIGFGVLFPTKGLYLATLEDPELSTAVCRVY